MMKAARFISLEHIFLIPLSIFALYFIKIKRTDAWKLSIIQTIIFFTLSRFFTNQNDNVNFVFYSPISIIPTNSWYLLKWFIISNMAILLTNFLIIKIPGIKNFSQTKITFNKLNN